MTLFIVYLKVHVQCCKYIINLTADLFDVAGKAKTVLNYKSAFRLCYKVRNNNTISIAESLQLIEGK
jgi:hypothetical protein